RIRVTRGTEVVAGYEGNREGSKPLVRDRIPGRSADDERMSARARIAGGDQVSTARTPRFHYAQYSRWREVRAIGEADDRGLHSRLERSESAAERGAGPPCPSGTIDHPSALNLD